MAIVVILGLSSFHRDKLPEVHGFSKMAEIVATANIDCIGFSFYYLVWRKLAAAKCIADNIILVCYLFIIPCIQK